MFDEKTFFYNLNRLIDSHRVSQQDLADIIGVSRQAISKIVNGKNLLTMDKLSLVADYFAVSVDYLIGRNDDPQYEIYIPKAESELLHNMPEAFCKIFHHVIPDVAKAKALPGMPLDEFLSTFWWPQYWELIRYFREWKKSVLEYQDYLEREKEYEQQETEKHIHKHDLMHEGVPPQSKGIIGILKKKLLLPKPDLYVNVSVADMKKMDIVAERLRKQLEFKTHEECRILDVPFPKVLLHYLYDLTANKENRE